MVTNIKFTLNLPWRHKGNSTTLGLATALHGVRSYRHATAGIPRK